MIERVDQLVLEYVSRAADAAHGVLPPRQRIDFVGRLRKRIDVERMGMDSPAAVEKVLAQFGDPVMLVRREVHRLNSETALGGLAETLEEAERPTGVIVPAPASGLHDSSEPLSGRSVPGDYAASGSVTADSAATGSVAGSAFSEPIPPGEDDLESPGSGRSDMTTFGASTSDRSGEAGFEWADSREPGAPRRSHPYGDVPGGSVPRLATPGPAPRNPRPRKRPIPRTLTRPRTGPLPRTLPEVFPRAFPSRRPGHDPRRSHPGRRTGRPRGRACRGG